MSSKRRVLIVTQELKPYLILSDISEALKSLPQYILEQGMEVRVLMPRFGTINERRHRLHEVVRLSGMNIVVNDDDYPLIIKVASLPTARLQVYFMDNEEFFKRKTVFEDSAGKPHEDNEERFIFFNKCVIETVRKFGWPPDIVHCNGWMTSLLPFYLRTVYKDDPVFKFSKIIYSVYQDSSKRLMPESMLEKAVLPDLLPTAKAAYVVNGMVNFDKGAMQYSDGVMIGSEKLDADLMEATQLSGKVIQGYLEGEELVHAYLARYNELMGEEVTSG